MAGLLTIGAWLLPLVLSGCDVVGPHHECYLGAEDVTAEVILAQFGSTLLLVACLLVIVIPLLTVAHRRSKRVSVSGLR